MSDWRVVESDYLGPADQQHNARLVRAALPGWTVEAVSALLGNMQAESTINPGIWENNIVGDLSAGFGLVQWTPATKLRNWIDATYGDGDYTNGDHQMARINYEMEQGIQYSPTYAYPETFREFSQSTKHPAYLAAAFLVNYERPTDQSEAVKRYRGELASSWYRFLTGHDPGGYLSPLMILLLKRASERR